MNKTFWKIKGVVFRERSSVVEHSTTDPELGGSIPLVPCLNIFGRAKTSSIFSGKSNMKNRAVINK